MIVSEDEKLSDLGFFRKKKKKKVAPPPPPPPTVDYGFKAPKSGGARKPGEALSPKEVPATFAPTSTGGSFIQENLHLIVGGLVAVSGIGVLFYLKRTGKL